MSQQRKQLVSRFVLLTLTQCLWPTTSSGNTVFTELPGCIGFRSFYGWSRKILALLKLSPLWSQGQNSHLHRGEGVVFFPLSTHAG